MIEEEERMRQMPTLLEIAKFATPVVLIRCQDGGDNAKPATRNVTEEKTRKQCNRKEGRSDMEC